MLTSDDAAALMAAQPLESPPGSTFEYSTGTTALLAGIAADALGGCAAATDYLTTRLLEPIGITTAQLVSDGGGCWFGGFGANMTTRDFARFGLLYLRGGEWDGRQIVPTAWVDESRVPAATEPGYGLQWWLRARRRGLLGGGSLRPAHRRRPRLGPRDRHELDERRRSVPDDRHRAHRLRRPLAARSLTDAHHLGGIRIRAGIVPESGTDPARIGEAGGR